MESNPVKRFNIIMVLSFIVIAIISLASLVFIPASIIMDDELSAEVENGVVSETCGGG